MADRCRRRLAGIVSKRIFVRWRESNIKFRVEERTLSKEIVDRPFPFVDLLRFHP